MSCGDVHGDASNFGNIANSVHIGTLVQSNQSTLELLSACASVSTKACLDLAQVIAGNYEEYETLATDLTNTANSLAPYATRLVTRDVSGSVGRIMESIKAELTQIGEQQDHRKLTRTVEANQGDIIQRYRKIESLFRQLQTNIRVQLLDKTRIIHETSLLKDLSPVVDARYDSNYSMAVKRRGCTVETRKNILKDIQDWAEDPKNTRLVRVVIEEPKLGGNYFCSRISALRRDVNNIVPTLAWQLAQYSPAFRSTLCKVIEENPDASKLGVKYQFEKLLQAPMQAMQIAMPEGVVVVIDALDECDDGDAFRLFLEVLLGLAAGLPIKFLVTSRPEPAIREKMLAPGDLRSALHLHDIEEWIVEDDIKKYLIEALGSMSPPPSSNDVERLAKLSGKLFIYAATTVRYIYPGGRGVNSNGRLRTVLGMASRSTKQHNELNKLYTSILSAAVDPEYLEDQEVNDILLTLRTVVCAEEPMTLQTLAAILSLTEERVRYSLEPLRSILHVQDGIHGLVSPFHASFPDYLLDHFRSGNFHCEATEHSEVLANCCFDLMKAQLRFNICKLESSFVFDEDVLDLQDRIKSFISSKQVLVIGTDMLRQVHTWLKVSDAEAFTARFAIWIAILSKVQLGA